MTPTLAPPAARLTRVRLLYEDSIVSFRLGAAPTFGEVAWAAGHLAQTRAAMPLAIDVTLMAPSPAVRDGTGTPNAR